MKKVIVVSACLALFAIFSFGQSNVNLYANGSEKADGKQVKDTAKKDTAKKAYVVKKAILKANR